MCVVCVGQCTHVCVCVCGWVPSVPMCMCASACLCVLVSVRMCVCVCGWVPSVPMCMCASACLCAFVCDHALALFMCVFVCAEATLPDGRLTIIEFIKLQTKMQDHLASTALVLAQLQLSVILKEVMQRRLDHSVDSQLPCGHCRVRCA